MPPYFDENLFLFFFLWLILERQHICTNFYLYPPCLIEPWTVQIRNTLSPGVSKGKWLSLLHPHIEIRRLLICVVFIRLQTWQNFRFIFESKLAVFGKCYGVSFWRMKKISKVPGRTYLSYNVEPVIWCTQIVFLTRESNEKDSPILPDGGMVWGSCIILSKLL